MKIRWMLMFPMVFAVNFVLATPSLDSKCRYTLATPINGNGVMFDESCRVAYIAPPRLGRAEVRALARTTNLQFCPAVKEASKVASRTFNVMSIISKKMEDMVNEYEPLSKTVRALRIDLAEAKIKMESAKKDFLDVDGELERLRNAIEEAKIDYQRCIALSSVENAPCSEEKSDWDDAKADYKQLFVHEYKSKRELADDATSEYKMLQARYDIEKDRYVEAIAPMVDLQQRMTELNSSVMDLYKEYAKIEGATGQIVWSIGWDILLEGYRRSNPHLRIEWRKLPLKSSELLTTIKDPVSSMQTGIPGLKSATIPGARTTGFLGMGSGEKITGIQTQPSDSGQSAIAFGDSVAGQIVLTLAGACPYFDGIEERNWIDSNELAKNVTANLIYTYDMAARRGYTASYNLSKLLNRFEKKSKKGGFFSTSSAHSIIEDFHSADWFSISFSANSSDFEYSITEQSEITKMVKKELMDKAISQFAILNAGSTRPPRVPEFLESGAARGSAELEECESLYCQAGSIILGVADSIWGKSTAVANFHRNNSTWVIEKVNGLHFVNRSGSLTFDQE